MSAAVPVTELVALVGVPGSGKTTIGQVLADQLGVEFADTDQLIAAREGRSVSDIFIEDGEDAFRSIEREVVAEALAQRTGVLALGGGAVLDANTRSLLAPIPTVWLTVDTDTAVKRVGLNAPRPMLLGNIRGQLKALTQEREPLYTEVATITLDTSERTPVEVAADVVAGLNSAQAKEEQA